MEKYKHFFFQLAGCLLVSALVIYFSVLSYLNYKKELIEMEETQLLTLAETLGKSLTDSIEQELEGMDLFFTALEYENSADSGQTVRDAISAYYREKDGLYHGVVCYDAGGQTVYETGSANFSLAGEPSGKEAVICGKSLTEQGQYEMYISRRFSCGAEDYTVLWAMDLSRIYTQVVQPVKIGQGGYSIIKDQDLSIIMHHASAMIGMDAVYDRLWQFPELDLSDLLELLELQKTEPSGYRVIDSYVWDSPDLQPEKRIVAYTTITLPGETWIVNSTLPFQELDGPLNKMFFRLAALSGLFLLFIAVFVFIITRTAIRETGQKKEIEYLKEINHGLELIRRKDEEIQHYQKIQTIGMMSSHISHEFNNYLTPVMVYGEILENDETLSPENKELVKGILGSVNQAAELSRKLLDFSRQDSVLVSTVIDIAADAGKAAAIIEKLAPKAIRFTAELPEGPLYIRGQKGMIEHILMNLSTNAFHAMEGQEGRLTIRLFAASPSDRPTDARQVTLSVSDTGCGIKKEALDKIFEPFYTTKRSGKGTGLGLSVVRNLVTSAGGQIQIESEEGKGTTFLLTFPETGPELEADSPAKKKTISHLVIVDDDEELLKALKEMSKAWPFRTEFFRHPAAVISRLQEQKDYCDMILTDYSMPVMNGLELAQSVRRLNPDIRLVLMSGLADERFDWYLKNRYIDQFILKTELSSLLTLIQ